MLGTVARLEAIRWMSYPTLVLFCLAVTVLHPCSPIIAAYPLFYCLTLRYVVLGKKARLYLLVRWYLTRRLIRCDAMRCDTMRRDVV